jgi:hypothetical protein
MNVRRVSWADLLFWVIVTAIIFSLVRPGSKAGAAVTAIVNAIAAVVGETTGYEQRGS